MVVTGTDDVFVLCTGGAPSASASGSRTRVLSAADCVVVVPDVFSWMGAAGAAVVTASGSSGGVKCALGIGPTRMGSRSLRTFRGLPHVTGVGFDVFPLCVSTRGFEPCHSVLRSNAHVFCFHVQAKYLRAMLP